MNTFLKGFHLVALAIFLGSIPGHILLGAMGDPARDLEGFAVLMQAKQMNVQWLTVPGLVITLLSGLTLMVRRGIKPSRNRWLTAKLALVVLVALNGALILGPLSREMATMAQHAVQAGALPSAFATLEGREAIFGAVNLAMILTIIGLVVAKPALRRANGPSAGIPR